MRTKRNHRAKEKELSRKPPLSVLRELRREVGFGCPVDGCGSPYLEWHHFDPEWHVEKHHRSEGMIALCPTHHGVAQGYTIDQIRALKSKPRSLDDLPRNQFNWLRHELLLYVGGNLFHETPVVFNFNGEDIISVSRNDEGYMTLNARMLTLSGEERMRVEENFWTVPPRPEKVDFECPPNGSSIKAKYLNGDSLEIKFRTFQSASSIEDFCKINLTSLPLTYPVTVVEVSNTIAGTDIAFTAEESALGGARITRCVMSRCRYGIVFNGPLPGRPTQRQRHGR